MRQNRTVRASSVRASRWVWLGWAICCSFVRGDYDGPLSTLNPRNTHLVLAREVRGDAGGAHEQRHARSGRSNPFSDGFRRSNQDVHRNLILLSACAQPVLTLACHAAFSFTCTKVCESG